MSQLCVTPDFIATCACSAPVTVHTPPANPTVYYDVTNGTPAAQHLLPANVGLPAIAVEMSGNGPLYVWNPKTVLWS